ncbi:MAG TPA: patatin-like phospholipase family protein [Candidatus Sulfotelmatobacter sp.]|nr:patatin-like phospholipase family protein [Candidatus Sulfotelmatobacter sp.]
MPAMNTTLANRPHRLLAIDGGGLAGLIPAEALVLIEKQLDLLSNGPQPLCKHFDLIAGTSTGAILAAGLALGLRATELRDFYLRFGKEIFTKSWLPLRFWHSYPSAPLEKHLQEVLGGKTTLGSSALQTQILIVTKNVTLGNNWFFSNNPDNKYFKSNSSLPLWEVVRASTAAPTYFPPHTISIPEDSGKKQAYEFVDGGISSYNNPALQVFLEATVPQYGYAWPTGVDQLLLLSLGTGFNSGTIEFGRAAGYNLVDWGQYVVKEMMNDANLQQNLLLHIIGQRPPVIRSATLELTSSGAAQGIPDEDALTRVGTALGAQKLLTYQRITVGLTRQRLDQLGLSDVDPVKVREMDAVDQILNLQRIGAAVAKEQVRMAVLERFF